MKNWAYTRGEAGAVRDDVIVDDRRNIVAFVSTFDDRNVVAFDDVDDDVDDEVDGEGSSLGNLATS